MSNIIQNIYYIGNTYLCSSVKFQLIMIVYILSI